MSRTLNAFADDDDIKEDDDPCLLTKIEESEQLQSKQWADNQKRIKYEIKDFLLQSIGGTPENYCGVEIKKVFGNRYRANLMVKDKSGNTKRPLSFFIHYQKDHITPDEKTPVTKLYSNYKGLNSETA